MHSSCIDAGLTLLHDIQAAHHRNLKTGLVLFDVKGFFDYVNHDRLVATLENLGVAKEIVQWADSFLRDRKVRLSFNNVTSSKRGQPVGVPQGSPISPVFSIIYTSGLLLKMKEWSTLFTWDVCR